MKKSAFIFIVLATVFLVVLGDTVLAQTSVSQWGTTPRGANGWKVQNTASTPAGNASMGAAAKPTGWMTIKGGFSALTATTSQAFVISGTFEFVGGGGGNAYTWLRYALFNGDGVLSNQNTDSAAWSETSNGYGYIFTPVSGAGTIANTYNSWPTGNQGTNWPLVNSKSWTSTNSNGGGPYSTIRQAPYQQVATAGVYDWAISVQPIGSGRNEVRWYFIQQHSATSTNYYWWGGSFIDSVGLTTSFNSIGFGVNSDIDAACTQAKLANVQVKLGTAITVPTAPFQSFYVYDWGTTPRGYAYNTGWKVLNDTNYLVGNASMGGTKAPTGWTSIKGGFRETVTPTTAKAMVITGTLELVGGGGGNAYTWLRYSLFHTAIDTLKKKNLDSAYWTESAVGNGYIFTPVSGAGTISNTYNTWPSGNQGTQWPLVNSKSWTSTNNNGGGPFSTVLQVPYHQEAKAGKYDWAISVQPLSSGGNEVRWYLIQQHAAGSTNYYWWGGSFIDPTPVATKFNSVGFAINSDIEAGCTRVNLGDVKVDLTDPITVPTAPWVAYYCDQWGFIGGRMYGWTFLRGEFVGNAGIGGTAPNQKWGAIRGAFDPVTPTTAKALLITGKVEFVGGGFQAANSLRVGLMYSEKAGKVIVDSAKATLPDSSRWDGVETYASGYLFIPPSGTNGAADWTGLSAKASSGAVVNGAWLHNDYPAAGAGILTSNYTLGSDLQTPANAVAGSGVYNLTMSVAVTAAGANDVRFKLAKTDNSYNFTAKVVDSKTTKAATKFNSINMAIGDGASATAMKLTDIKIDYVDVATVPITEYPSGVTGVEEGGAVPTEFGLAQNYPNPFNPATTISYSVAKASHVTIRVYDVLGRMVAQLVDAMQKPSSYTVQWNPGALSSGTYLYRIDAQYEDGSGTFSAVKKLLYMK